MPPLRESACSLAHWLPWPASHRCAPLMARVVLLLSQLAEGMHLAQVVIPVTVPGHGPLGITLLGLAKSDAALVTAAAKLGPLIAESITTLGKQASRGVHGCLRVPHACRPLLTSGGWACRRPAAAAGPAVAAGLRR